MYDVIIAGSGPAGLSAALYTSRANLKTLVIGKDRGALEKADKIENYFGMSEPISGCELVDNTKMQVQNLGAELAEDEIFHNLYCGGQGEILSCVCGTSGNRNCTANLKSSGYPGL